MSGAEIGSWRRSGWRRSVFVCGFLVGVVSLLAAGCDILMQGPGGDAARADRRVRIVLENLVSAQGRGGREADPSTALAAWWDGSSTITDPVISARASDEFRDWREQKGLVYGGLGSFEILTTTPPDAETAPTLVEVQIDGDRFVMAVKPHEPIWWAR